MTAFFRRPVSSAAGESAVARLGRLSRRAGAALLWEQVWRRLWAPACVVGLFLAVSWTGLWLGLPHAGRVVGVVVFALALAASLVPLRRLRRPAAAEALARIDERSGLPHRPAATLLDSLSNGGSDPTTAALWSLHQRRAEAEARRLRAGFPAPRLQEHDRYALRAGVLVALVAMAVVAGPERYARTAAAFDWSGTAAATRGARLDAWLDPPRYTGRPPLLLNVAAGSAPQRIEAPAGSILIARASDGSVTLKAGEGLQPAAPDDKPAQRTGEGPEERRVLKADTRLTLHAAGGGGVYDIVAIPDRPPSIALTAAPRMNLRGTFGLAYQVADDYGVVGAEATFAAPVVDGRPPSRRSLVDPPKVQLALPAGAGNLGAAETIADLSDHPWAGARVEMTLVAHDEGGNEGRSDPVTVELPQKTWTKPLARALAEQRRAIVLAPDDRARVDQSLEALGLAPEVFGTNAGVYLGLRVARERLRLAHTDADLRDVADFLWQMALQIENGDLNDTEKDLRAAEQKLQDALAKGASDEEIAQLTNELRAAMDKFLKDFAARQPRDNAPEGAQAQRGRTVTPKDLQAMLDRMREMARTGDRADAQRTLDQLRNMLDNLQSAGRRNPRQRDMAQALGDLDKLTREQQQLRDETYQKGRKGAQPGQNGLRGGMQDEDDEEDADDGESSTGSQMSDADRQTLQKRQQALRDRLAEVQKRLKGLGQDGGDLGSADGAMGDAGEALGQSGGRAGRAVDAQGRALEALRKGAEQMAQAMSGGGGQPGGEDQAGEGDGEAPGGQPRQADGGSDTDPLGRPTLGNPMYNPGSRYDPLGVPAAQRAQRVLEELRRRLSDPARPRDETDYLERLLRRY